MPAPPPDLSPKPAAPPAAWRLLGLLALVYALHMLDRQVIAIVLEPLRREFLLKDSQLGLLSGLAYSAAAIVAGIPAGMLADRVSRRKLLISALVLWSGITAACGAATGYATLLLTRAGVGAAESGGPPAALSMIADAFPPAMRGRAAGLFYAAGAVGTVSSFTAGAAITTTWGWRTTFVCAALPGFALAILLAARLREPARGTPATAGTATGGGRLDPALVVLIAGMTLVATGPSAVGAWSASLLVRAHGLDLRAAGLVLAVAAGVFVPLGQLGGGWWAGRLARRRPGSEMLLAGLASAAGAVLVAAAIGAARLPLVIGGITFGMLFLSVFMGPSFGLLMTLAPERTRATVLATAAMLGNLAGYGGGPVLVGYLSDRIGGPAALSTALAIAMVLPLLGALLLLYLARMLTLPGRSSSPILRG